LLLSTCLALVAWSAPIIQSIDVSPNPLTPGQTFTITVTASPDATLGATTVDFRPGAPRLLRVPLVKQGSIWTGSGLVPPDLQVSSHGAAIAKVLLFDSARRRTEDSVNVNLNPASVSAAFAGDILTVTGDDQDNTLIVSRDGAGTILVNGGAVPVTGGVATVANTSLIRMFGLAGNDVLAVDDSNGPMPPAHLLGGEGDDTLTGSASDDVLEGGPGNDTLAGGRGNDRLVGGPGNDILIGGPGSDEIFGGEGDDQIIWNPGDGSDLVEGEEGKDTLVFNGANVNETVDLSANGQRLRFFRNVANITMDCNGIEVIQFNARGGADTITVNDLTGTDVTNVTLDLAAIPGSGQGDNQADTVFINGTDNDDHITITESTNGVSVLGLSAAVTLLGTELNLDQLVIHGLGGDNAVDFIGSTTNATVNFSPDGQRVRFSSDADGVGTECDGVQQVNFHSLEGGDEIIVSDLTGTEVTKVGIDLSGDQPGVGNGLPDSVIVNGTDGPDNITLTGSTNGVNIVGLSAEVSIVGAKSGLDSLVINALGGADVVDASGVEAGVIELTLNGGDGDDQLIGGQGNDLLIGGRGSDVMFGGPGDDTFVWNPGDGSDVIEGQAGQNTLLFNGANVAETVVLSPNGQRLLFTRNVASITMDCDGVEVVQFSARGGADNITVNDLAGTSVTNVSLDLASIPGSGSGDNAADTVIINGTSGNDVINIAGDSTGVTVQGLAATVHITGSEAALDQLVINALDGDDAVTASQLQAGVIALKIDGGPGNDVLVGSAGDDVLLGGDGDDILTGGPGLDVLDGGSGNNVIIQ
jgi:Ca2+-binding RTX toxin-like protein